TTNLQVIWQAGAFADKRNPAIQARRFQLIWRHIIASANLTIFPNAHFFIQNGVVNHTACSDDTVKEDNRVSYYCYLLDDDARREHTALNLTSNNAAMRDQATGNLCPTANLSWRSLFTARVNDP